MTGPRDRWRALAIVSAIYIVAPGHTDAWFSGVPLGLWPLAALVVVVAAGALCEAAAPASRGAGRAVAVLAALTVVKVAAAAVAPPLGWAARYYATADGRVDGPPRRGIGIVPDGATRVDRRIDFRGTELPLYFVNEADLNRGNEREEALPVLCVWTAHAPIDRATPLALSLEAAGRATFSVDGADVLAADRGRAAATVALTPGDRTFTVRYLKPAGVAASIRLQGLDIDVAPRAVAAWRLRTTGATRMAATIADLLALAAAAFGAFALRPRLRSTSSAKVAAVLLLLFFAQGLVRAAPFHNRAVSLTAGDDWLSYEANARAVASGDVLMLVGARLGEAAPFFYYPAYSYFLALVHIVGGEDLAAPILTNFLLLFAATVLAYRLGIALFGTTAALVAMALLVGVEELAFVRYYTVTLLSENLYLPLVAGTLLSLARFVERGSAGAAMAAGLLGGVATLTRSSFVLFIVPAALLVAVGARQRGMAGSRVVRGVALAASAWAAVVGLSAARNYVADGSMTLVDKRSQYAVVAANLPGTADDPAYLAASRESWSSTFGLLGRMFVEHPGRMVQKFAIKIAFCFGLLTLMGIRWHPEMLLVSAGYIAAVVLSRRARRPETWPVHAFVAAHVAGVALYIPTLYGYRLLLPLYLLFPLFAAAIAVELVERRSGGRMMVAT